MGFVVIEPENLKFKHETTKNKKTPFIIKNIVQVEDPKRQREGFLNHYDFAYLVETQLIKLLRLPLVLLKLSQTISPILQNKGLTKSFPKGDQKWKECSLKY